MWPAIAGVLAALLILNERIPSTSPEQDTVYRLPGYRQAVATATPSVVNIYTKRSVADRRGFRLLTNPFMPLPRGVPRQRIERSLGSGVIMRADGYILTNFHVVRGAQEIEVLLSDGRSVAATVVGTDESLDLAALRIDLENVSPIPIADSNTLSVGDVVLAIGNPLGFGHSVTQGIVSGLGRMMLNLGAYEGYIQTDAVIHPGSSGGALVDSSGALVGINTLIYTAGESNSNSNVGIGISLAIPSNLADYAMHDLIRYGRLIRGWLGVEVELLPEAGLGGQRLLVLRVASDGPAERAGLRAGDVITHFDDEPVSDVRLSMLDVEMLRPGDKLKVTVARDGTSVDLDAIVGAEPESA
ncbi:MAG: trypsin-like peptidase domain-containing protein [Pseudomonadota bacterium]